MRRTLLGIVLALLCMAPTAGDIGGCGAEVTALDPSTFALVRKDEDCRRCEECAIGSARCARACDPDEPVETRIPDTCKPLLHDGKVCLRALRAASCSAYARYVDDVAPETPSECAFCKAPPDPPVAPLAGEGAP